MHLGCILNYQGAHFGAYCGAYGTFRCILVAYGGAYCCLYKFVNCNKCVSVHDILVNYFKSQMDVKRNLVSIMDYYLLCVMGYSVEKISLSNYD